MLRNVNTVMLVSAFCGLLTAALGGCPANGDLGDLGPLATADIDTDVDNNTNIATDIHNTADINSEVNNNNEVTTDTDIVNEINTINNVTNTAETVVTNITNIENVTNFITEINNSIDELNGIDFEPEVNIDIDPGTEQPAPGNEPADVDDDADDVVDVPAHDDDTDESEDPHVAPLSTMGFHFHGRAWLGEPYESVVQECGFEDYCDVEVDGGVPPYVWSIAAGSLPAGLSLNSQTGRITGVPTVPSYDMGGDSEFTLRVEDAAGQHRDWALSINIPLPRPVADAGPEQRRWIWTANEITLDGSASDLKGRNCTFEWVQIYASHPVSLANPNALSTSFVVEAPEPPEPGDSLYEPWLGQGYTFELRITNEEGATSTDCVRINLRDKWSPHTWYEPADLGEGDSHRAEWRKNVTIAGQHFDCIVALVKHHYDSDSSGTLLFNVREAPVGSLEIVNVSANHVMPTWQAVTYPLRYCDNPGYEFTFSSGGHTEDYVEILCHDAESGAYCVIEMNLHW